MIKNVRLATYASRCIENEILMHFRAQKKLAGEVSLADSWMAMTTAAPCR